MPEEKQNPQAQTGASAALARIAAARASRANAASGQARPATASTPAAAPAASGAGQKSLFNRTGAPQAEPTMDAREQRRPAAAVDPRLTTVAGKVTKVFFGGAVGEKALLLVQPASGEAFKLQGRLTCAVKAGTHVTAQAVLEQHAKFGAQYESELVIEDVPTDRLGAVGFLESRMALSKAAAAKLYDSFGDKVFIVLDEEPARFLGISGINETRLETLKSAWATDSAFRKLWKLLTAHGVGGQTAARIFEKHGVDSVRIARDTPYKLASVPGIGFDIADAIANEGGRQSDANERVIAAFEHVLELAASNGHTAMRQSVVVADVHEVAGRTKEGHVDSVLAKLLADGDLTLRSISGEQCLSLTGAVEMESTIAEHIQRLMKAAGPDEKLAAKARSIAENPPPGRTVDAEQTNAVGSAFESAVSVITGRPGGGKTTVTEIIANVASEAALTVVMCAPTAKAAQRTKEATGFASGTLHSLLKPVRGQLGVFTHDETNPLDVGLYVVDESSMVDTPLAASFLAALPAGARLLIVGDVDQLESVGPGKVLADIIASGAVPVARLNTPHRTALNSDIVTNAHAVINGQVDKVDLKGEKDFRFVQAVEDDEIRRRTLARYTEAVRKYGADNVQVLIARKPGAVGVTAINEMLRSVVNPACPDKLELKVGDTLFRKGDRVMRTKNNYELGIFNGEVGIISDVDAAGKWMKVTIGDRTVKHEGKEMRSLELALAMTNHKSQGSEYACVICLVPPGHKSQLNRNMLYTSFTRGRKETQVIGCEQTLRAGVLRRGGLRTTGLAQEIRAAFGLAPAAAPAREVARPAATSVPAPESTVRATPPTPASATPVRSPYAALNRSRPATPAPVATPAPTQTPSSAPTPPPAPAAPPAEERPKPWLVASSQPVRRAYTPLRQPASPAPNAIAQRPAAAPVSVPVAPPAPAPVAPVEEPAQRMSMFRRARP